MHTHAIWPRDNEDREITTHSLADAIIVAKALLDDDAELGFVNVYTVGDFAQVDEYLGQVVTTTDRFGNQDFEMTWAREERVKVTAAESGLPYDINPVRDDSDAYDLNDPKHPTFVERMADYVDIRKEL